MEALGSVWSFLEAGPPWLAAVVLLSLAAVPCALVHELGHAFAAAALREGGDQMGRRRSAAVALAGPAASTLGCVAALGAYGMLPSGGLAHDVTWALVIAGVAGVLLDLLPVACAERRSWSAAVRVLEEARGPDLARSRPSGS